MNTNAKEYFAHRTLAVFACRRREAFRVGGERWLRASARFMARLKSRILARPCVIFVPHFGSGPRRAVK